MRDFTLYDIFIRNSRVAGGKTALVSAEGEITFAQLRLLADRAVERLLGLGVEQGDRVAVLAYNHPAFFVLLGAVARLGAILVPLNWRLAEEEIRYILEDSGARLVFADSGQYQRAREIGEPLVIPLISLEDLLDDDSGEALPYSSGPQDIGAAAPVCIIYTAAVDGRPRGAVLSHGNLLAANLQVICSMALTPQDCHLAMLPLFHITGMNLALAVMQLGGRNVVMVRFDEKEAIALTMREKVSLWGSFPPMLQRLGEQMEQSESVPESLKYVVGIDNPENIARFEERCRAKFWILYGQSETSGFVTFSPASAAPGTAGSQGLITTFRLVDDADQEVAVGQTGEIVVRGPLVFQGYWNLDEVNRATFRNGWHHTGDLGMMDDNGYLVYKGRKPEKELIKPGGENVYPAEVEAVILTHPAIQAVCVIGVPDPKFGEGVKAVCVLEDGQTLAVTDLIEYVGSRIARYKKPGYVQYVAELPQKDGRVDRLKVKELYG